ncbi:hypothetical protein ADL21_11155 [Streptomyces albus subsp. albus]|nr:hypothetical protein ADL21_11155 [Streptomyces albus subsp. albus]
MIVPVAWKAAEEDGNILEGYASTFGNVDLQHDVIAQGAFKNAIPAVRKGQIPLLADHSASVRDVLGTLIDAGEDTKGLKIKAQFASDPDAQAIRQKMLDGHISKMSIGYQPLQWRYETRGEDRVRVLEDIKLWEVSAVVFPANPEAVVSRVKAAVRKTVDTVVAGAVASGGDEQEIKAALSAWLDTTAESDPVDAAQSAGTPPDRTPRSTDTTHLDTKDAEGREGAEQGTEQAQHDSRGPESLTLALHRADAVLAGRDPDEAADPVTLAGIEARLELFDQWIKQSTREDELLDELNSLRGDR